MPALPMHKKVAATIASLVLIGAAVFAVSHFAISDPLRGGA